MGSDLMARRREMFQSADYTSGELRYWLSSEDEPSLRLNTTDQWLWRDKVKEIPFILNGGLNCYDYENKVYTFDTLDKSATLLANMAYYDVALGHHWRIEFDVDYKYTNSQSAYLLDFNSVGNSNHALGVTLIGPGQTKFLNWKMNGNNSNPFGRMTHPTQPSKTPNEYTRFKGFFTMQDRGNGYDKFTAVINGIKVEYDTLVPQVNYDFSNDRTGLYISRGASNGHSSLMKIRDIKIYVID